MLQELIVAACLVLVLEGMLPFLSPRLWRQTMQSLLALDRKSVVKGKRVELEGGRSSARNKWTGRRERR